MSTRMGVPVRRAVVSRLANEADDRGRLRDADGV
jgi:hypothetical protein